MQPIDRADATHCAQLLAEYRAADKRTRSELWMMYIGMRRDFDAIDNGDEQASPLESVLRDRAERGLSGILYEVYCAAYCAGAGMVDDAPRSESMRSLIWLLEDRRRTEQPPREYDNLPGWLLTLAQQADTIEPPAIDGWPV